MSECLGLYIENKLIKYAKVSKEHDTFKIEAFGIKTYDEKIDEVLKQIIQETYSFNTPLSINLSDEIYNYFNIFSMLNKKDVEHAIRTEFEFLCEEKGLNKNTFESKFFSVANIDNTENLRTIHISANKTEIARKSQQLEGYKLKNISPLPVSIVNLVELKPNENIAIVNIEGKTSITLIINGQVYKVDMLEDGMGKIFDKINVRENSYSKVYDICKNTTIYTAEGRGLQEDESEYLEEIMPTLYSIVSRVKNIITDEKLEISKVYLTGSGTVINNIDLYFQEILNETRCEILKPYFIQLETLRLNIKDYIEVNSAIALALQGLGEGLKEINFKHLTLMDKIDLPKLRKDNNGKNGKNGKTSINALSKIKDLLSSSFDFRGGLDTKEKYLLRLAISILMLIIIYSVFSYIIGNQIKDKIDSANLTIGKMNSEISLVDADINRIRTRKSQYTNSINKLKEINEKNTEKYKARNAIPNLLNRIMSIIPKNVQLTSIENTAGTHVVIKAQSENYEQLGMFKAQIILDKVLLQVKSDTSNKQDGLVKVTIEGELP